MPQLPQGGHMDKNLDNQLGYTGVVSGRIGVDMTDILSRFVTERVNAESKPADVRPLHDMTQS